MKSLILALLFATASSTALSAAELARPTGDVVLTVTGDISITNADGKAEFDMAMLDAIAGRDVSMETPWTDGATRFSGPELKSLLTAVGAEGKTLRVKALNDYSADIPSSDAYDFPTMLASRMNGEEMSVRDKGPLFLIYPFDVHPELYNEKYFSRSVWQISEIEVIE